ncbi:MAG: hypothetical protein H5T72_05585 [Actinobacteria bacterium]|nr:hypothetical protein [Actinomycetota bacterium]
MNRFYLIVRLLVLAALFFLLAAVFWGIANRDKTVAHGDEQIAEEYRRTKPEAYTSYLLIAFVVSGIFILLGSIIYDFHDRCRKKAEEARMNPYLEEGRRGWCSRGERGEAGGPDEDRPG